MPAFLLGAFGPAIKDEFGIGDTGLGAVFTVGYLVSALTLQLAGEFADRRGAQPALRTAMTISIISAVLFGLVNGLAFLFVAYGFVRLAESISQPSTNTMIGAMIPVRQQGRAMGFKQAAIPTATGLAGLAVPLLGDQFGWRSAFMLLAAPALAVWLLVPQAPVRPRSMAAPRGDLLRRRYLRSIAIGGAFAAGAMTSVGGFLVSGAEEAGFSESRAGLLLTLGAVFMVPARISWGIMADRHRFDRFRGVAVCLSGAAVALALFSVGTQTTIVVGTVLMFAVGWSWPGLLLFGVLEQHPNEPGAATGLVQTAVRVGAMISPLIFGSVADNAGYSTAWLVSLTSALLGAAFMLRGSMLLRSEDQHSA